jgi:hypothetical protein
MKKKKRLGSSDSSSTRLSLNTEVVVDAELCRGSEGGLLDEAIDELVFTLRLFGLSECCAQRVRFLLGRLVVSMAYLVVS